MLTLKQLAGRRLPTSESGRLWRGGGVRDQKAVASRHHRLLISNQGRLGNIIRASRSESLTPICFKN